MNPRKKILLASALILGVLAGAAAWKWGFYTIQPIGAVPDGSTWFVWREKGEPFFNSADRLCLDRLGSISLLSRGIALAQAPKERIIVRLPYWKFAYLRSTGGQKFSR